MRMRLKDIITTLVVALSIALFTSGTARADDDSGHHSERHHGHHGKQHRRHDAERRHHRRQHGKYNRKHHRGRHYRGHHGRHVTNVYRHDDDDGEKLLIGLLVGGLVGYAIHESQQSYGDSSTAYTYTTNERVINPPAFTRQHDSICLQEREYLTKVFVGGRRVDAYGTACLQPDGSWMRGPARVANF